MNLFWNGVTAIATALSLAATVLIYILARKELTRNNKISELEIYFRIKSDFSSIEFQTIYRAILEKHIEFFRRHNEPPAFSILGQDNHWVPFPMTNVEQGFLGHIEDLALAHESDLISFETVKSGYGSLILNSGNSPCIYNFISYLRNEKFKDSELFSGFEQLYLKLYQQLPKDQKVKYRPVLL